MSDTVSASPGPSAGAGFGAGASAGAAPGADSGDRRVRRSRAAITSAFVDLTLEQGYARVAPGDVAARAEVARSTFYSHFSGLDDLLAHSLDRHLATLARCTLAPDLDPALVRLMEHFWQQRAAARTILRDAALATIARALADRLEATLVALARARRSHAALPARLVATQMSAGQLAALGAWLAGRSPASPDEMARLLHATTYAGALAIL